MDFLSEVSEICTDMLRIRMNLFIQTYEAQSVNLYVCKFEYAWVLKSHKCSAHTYVRQLRTSIYREASITMSRTPGVKIVSNFFVSYLLWSLPQQYHISSTGVHYIYLSHFKACNWCYKNNIPNRPIFLFFN